jgi:hypothetical protein
MSTNTRLMLNLPAQSERFEHRERGDYDLDRFDEEFQERLYSDRGREILQAWEQRQVGAAEDQDR